MSLHLTASSAVLGMLLALPVAAQDSTSDDALIDLGPMFEAMGEDDAPAPQETPEESAVAPQVPPPATDPTPSETPEQNPAPEPVPESVQESGPESAPESATESPPPAELPNYMRDGPVAEAGQAGPVFVPLIMSPYQRTPRISGEAGSVVTTLQIDDPSRVERLQIALVSSVNNLPAESRLTVLLNETEILSDTIQSFDDFSTIFLPADGLVPGENRLELRVRQAHRIFCGPDASFAIWTEFDLAQSGAVVSPGDAALTPAALRLALIRQIVSGNGVTVESDGAADPALMVQLAQRVNGLVPGSMVRFVVTDPYAVSATQAEPVRVRVMPDGDPSVSLRTGGDGALVLVIGNGADPALLEEFLPTPPALVGPAATQPGQATLFADLGSDAITMESRYSRSAVSFTLPDDWLMIAARDATIGLNYHYAAGLPPNAQMLVKVNEQTVRLLPLHGEGNIDLPVLDIGFPALLLAPGVNQVSFETIIPGDPPNLPCGFIDGPFVEISGNSTLSVPDSPEMRFPRTGTALRALDPQGISGVAGIDPAGVAGATLTALQSGLVAIEGSQGGTLRIAGIRSADALQLEQMGLSRTTFEYVLAPPATSGAPPQADGWQSLPRQLWQNIVDMAAPGDPPLDRWIIGRQAHAILFLPDADQPLAAELLVAPSADPTFVARAIADARLRPDGPSGQLSLLTADGKWQNWQAATRAPHLDEPLTWTNFRDVAANYASWSPLGYVALVAALLVTSVLVGLLFVTNSRGSRKR